MRTSRLYSAAAISLVPTMALQTPNTVIIKSSGIANPNARATLTDDEEVITLTLSPTLQATDLSTGTLMSVSLHSDALQCPDRPHPAQADDRTTRTLTLVGVICSTMPSLLTALTDLGDELADVVKPILNTKAMATLPIY